MPKGDLISRSDLKKVLCEKYEAREHYIGEKMLEAIDNATAVTQDCSECKRFDFPYVTINVEFTEEEKQEIIEKVWKGLLVMSDEKANAKPQNAWIENKVIVETLGEMLSNLCMGCGGCNDKCLDYRVLEYLLKEKGGNE